MIATNEYYVFQEIINRKSEKLYDPEDVLKFEEALKELCGSFAPLLTNLTLQIQYIDYYHSSNNPFDFELLKLYLPKMNNFFFVNNTLRARRF